MIQYSIIFPGLCKMLQDAVALFLIIVAVPIFTIGCAKTTSWDGDNTIFASAGISDEADIHKCNEVFLLHDRNISACDYSYKPILDREGAIEFEDIQLGDILEFIHDNYDLPIVIDNDEALKDRSKIENYSYRLKYADWRGEPINIGRGMPTKSNEYGELKNCVVPSITICHTQLGDILSILVRMLGLEYVCMPDYVLISTPNHICEKILSNPENYREYKTWVPNNFNNIPSMYNTWLMEKCSVDVADISLREVLGFISDSWNINFVYDTRCLQQRVLPENNPAPDLNKMKNSPDSIPKMLRQMASPYDISAKTVEKIFMMDVPLSTFLVGVLAPLSLTHYSEKNYVWITCHPKIAFDDVSEMSVCKALVESDVIFKAKAMKTDPSNNAILTEHSSFVAGMTTFSVISTIKGKELPKIVEYHHYQGISKLPGIMGRWPMFCDFNDGSSYIVFALRTEDSATLIQLRHYSYFQGAYRTIDSKSTAKKLCAESVIVEELNKLLASENSDDISYAQQQFSILRDVYPFNTTADIVINSNNIRTNI